MFFILVTIAFLILICGYVAHTFEIRFFSTFAHLNRRWRAPAPPPHPPNQPSYFYYIVTLNIRLLRTTSFYVGSKSGTIDIEEFYELIGEKRTKFSDKVFALIGRLPTQNVFINQSINQSIKQSVSQSVSQSINLSDYIWLWFQTWMRVDHWNFLSLYSVYQRTACFLSMMSCDLFFLFSTRIRAVSWRR